MARKSRKQKTADKKIKKQQGKISGYEAAASSKAALTNVLLDTGKFKSKNAAKTYINDVYQGKTKLTPDLQKQLDKQLGGKASREQTKEYVSKILRPREKRAAVTNRTKFEKRASEQIMGLGLNRNGERIFEVLEKNKHKPNTIFDDHTIKYDEKNYGKYVTLFGEVLGDSPKPGEKNSPAGTEDNTYTKFYHLPVYDKRPIMTGVGVIGGYRTVEYFPGFKAMTPEQKKDYLANEFNSLTNGKGILYGYYFSNELEIRRGE